MHIPTLGSYLLYWSSPRPVKYHQYKHQSLISTLTKLHLHHLTSAAHDMHYEESYHWAVCHREQHCLSLWCQQTPESSSMVLHRAYSSSVKMMAVFVVLTPCFRRTYCLHLKGEWLGEGGCEVKQWKKTCQFEGICPIAATEGVHRKILPLSSEWLNWFW